ncbi:MAG: restriction endonuclease [Candidatus Hodarchaeales archaeon]|jgi:hypothetical protein
MSADLLTKPLPELVQTTFETLGFITHHPMRVLKHPLADSRISFVIKQVNSKSKYTGVIVREWKRIVGVGQIHKAEELLQSCPELEKILIVSSMGFSYSATRLAEKAGIGLLSKGELISLLMKRIEIR